MIIDNNIDEVTARYWCIANKQKILEIASQAKKNAVSDNEEKDGIQAAIALGPNGKEKLEAIQTKLDESQLDEGFWRGVYDFLFNSPPAWVDEPTGLNLTAPEDVFKDDVAGGIVGYNQGTKMATAAGAAAIGASIPIVRNAAAKVAKTGVKTAVKHPVATTVGVVAAKNYDTVKDVAANAGKELSALGKMIDKCQPFIDKVCAFFSPLVDFFKEHPLAASALGAIGYGLLRTYPLWSPYLRRMWYELRSGKCLAKVNFEANDTSYTFEYTANKRKWTLLNSGKIASVEDASSFMNTEFAKKFIAKCKDNFDTLFAHKDMILASSALENDKSMMSAFKELFDQEKDIKANLYSGKLLFERRSWKPVYKNA